MLGQLALDGSDHDDVAGLELNHGGALEHPLNVSRGRGHLVAYLCPPAYEDVLDVVG